MKTFIISLLLIANLCHAQQFAAWLEIDSLKNATILQGDSVHCGTIMLKTPSLNDSSEYIYFAIEQYDTITNKPLTGSKVILNSFYLQDYLTNNKVHSGYGHNGRMFSFQMPANFPAGKSVLFFYDYISPQGNYQRTIQIKQNSTGITNYSFERSPIYIQYFNLVGQSCEFNTESAAGIYIKYLTFSDGKTQALKIIKTASY